MQRKHNKNIVPTAKMLRKNMTKEEKHLWYDFLRAYHSTEEAKQYDKERTAFLEEYGLTVIRVPNTEIHKNFQGVCEYIDHLVEQSLSQLR